MNMIKATNLRAFKDKNLIKDPKELFLLPDEKDQASVDKNIDDSDVKAMFDRIDKFHSESLEK